MNHMTEEAKLLLAKATEKGAENLCKKLLSPEAAMPSIKDIESELGSDFINQDWNVVKIHDTNNCPTRRTLNEHDFKF